MNSNHGRLAIYANTMGVFFGRKLVKELNKLLDKEGSEQPRIKLKHPKVREFLNSMLTVSLEERVRGEDAFLVQWFPKPAGVKESKYTATRNKEEFFQTISALFQAGVNRLTLVTPYAYDQRKDTLEGRDTIGAALFCQELGGITHGRNAHQAFCLDIHAQQIVGYYQMVEVNMVSVPVFQTYIDFIKENYSELLENSLIIAPDAGSAKRGRAYSHLTGLDMIIINKRRVDSTQTVIESYATRGVEVKGKKGLLVDDVLATGSTACEPLAYLMGEGLAEAYILVTHPEVTDIKKLDAYYKKGLFKKIFIADTTRLPKRDYFVQVPTSKLIAKLIYNIHTDQSIGHYLEY